MYDLIAILGRGIQKDKKLVKKVKKESKKDPWVLTEDLEVCDKNSAHLVDRVPMDDSNPYCMIGGGEANLLAGKLLMRQCMPKVVVCAYGHKAKYLEPEDFPNESGVMGEQLRPYLPSGCELVTWERNRYPSPLVPSNTRQEMLNVLDLALERGLSRIAFIAIGVHMPRAATYLSKHMTVYRDRYRNLSTVMLETEELLLSFDREKYSARVEAIRNSRAFARNWVREADGISKIVRDVYGDAKPLVVVK